MRKMTEIILRGHEFLTLLYSIVVAYMLIKYILVHVANKMFPYALKARKEWLIYLIIKFGANVRAYNCDGNKTALHSLFVEAAEEKLLKKCSDKERVIASERRVRIAKRLIEEGADVDAVMHSWGHAPLEWSVLHSKSNFLLIQLFMVYGNLDVNKKNNKNGRNLAQEYIANTTRRCVADGDDRVGIEPLFLRLIEPSENYTSPLHEACIFHMTEKIRELTILLADGDIDAKDTFGHTPLYYAVMSSNGSVKENKKNTVKLLLDLGADIKPTYMLDKDLLSRVRYTIFELSLKIGDKEICWMLVQHANKTFALESEEEKEALRRVHAWSWDMFYHCYFNLRSKNRD